MHTIRVSRSISLVLQLARGHFSAIIYIVYILFFFTKSGSIFHQIFLYFTLAPTRLSPGAYDEYLTHPLSLLCDGLWESSTPESFVIHHSCVMPSSFSTSRRAAPLTLHNAPLRLTVFLPLCHENAWAVDIALHIAFFPVWRVMDVRVISVACLGLLLLQGWVQRCRGVYDGMQGHQLRCHWF